MQIKPADKIFSSSVRRLIADGKDNFRFMRDVPSSHVRVFADYWLNVVGITKFVEFAETLPYPNLSEREKKSIAPQSLAEYTNNAMRRWDMLSEWGKHTRGRMFLRRGRIAAYLREGATDDDLKEYGEANLKWPTEQEIFKSFGKEFEMQLLHREGSAEYRVSSKQGVLGCETRLIIHSKLKFISYYHLLDSSQESFTLIDHSGDWCFPANWNLVTHDNLESTVSILKQITDDFESSVG